MKKVMKVISIIAIFIIFFITVCYGAFDVSDLQGNQEGLGSLKITGDIVVKVISTIGVVVSVIMLIVIGLKYMLGSVGEKAEYKKSLLPYIIGAILVFASSIVAQIIYDIAKDL